MRYIALLSGGMDSTTLVYHLLKMGHYVETLSFDYGQRHRRELKSVRDIINQLQILGATIDLRGLGLQLGLHSSLVNPTVEVPEGRYDAPSMTQTIVPNRNAIMLSIAYGIAVSRKADGVAYAAHAGDHAIYPDCREVFADAFAHAMDLANEPAKVEFLRPFIHSTKAEIVALGETLNVPWSLTWSCYKGGERHCGRCGTCVERAEAFSIAGVKDPTDYEDPDYWKSVTKETL